jgi:hypothetical protein
MVRHLAPSIPCLGRMPVDQANENPCDLGIWQEDSTHARTTRRSAAVPYHRVLREVVVRILSVYPEHGARERWGWMRLRASVTTESPPGSTPQEDVSLPRPRAPRDPPPHARRPLRDRTGGGAGSAADSPRKRTERAGPVVPSFVAAGESCAFLRPRHKSPPRFRIN